MPRFTLVSAFSGIGGLDLGLERAGFSPLALFEKDPDARAAIKILRPNWNLLDHADVCTITPDVLKAAGLKKGSVTVLAGGPPCQPFSRAGQWSRIPMGYDDPRAATMSAFFRLAAMLEPEILLIENVPGLINRKFGMQALKAAVTRLNSRIGSKYDLSVHRICAEHYGIPQSRHRIFLVAHREGKLFTSPQTTHSEIDEEIRSGAKRRLTTAWDAIGHLENSVDWKEHRCSGRWADLLPSIPEGMNYLVHTRRTGGYPLFGYRTRYWSFLLKLAKNMPSWTIPASPGPATGPFHWTNRRLSISEMGALQTIPDVEKLDIPLRTAQRLLGNAVPGAVGELLGKSIMIQLLGQKVPPNLSLIPSHRKDCPPPLRAGEIPVKFMSRGISPKDHPGEGMGPGADFRKKRSAKVLV